LFISFDRDLCKSDFFHQEVAKNRPHPLNPMFDKQKIQMIYHWKAFKKIPNIDFFFAKFIYIKNVFKKKIPKNEKYTFLKNPWPCHFKYAKF